MIYRSEGEIVNKHEIWIINHYAITPDLPGGTRHYDFGCELVKKGYNVRIFASDVNLALRRHTKLQKNELWREENVNGVRFTWVRAATYKRNDWRRAWNMLSFSVNVLRAGIQIKERPGTIIGSSPHPFAALSGWLLARAKRSSFLLEVRDLWPQALIDMGALKDRSLVTMGMRLLEYFLYKVARKIIILAPGSRGYLNKRGVQDNKIVYIPNGVHFGHFQADEAFTYMWTDKTSGGPSSSKDHTDKRPFIVMYAGAHGPANALDTIIEAARLLCNRTDIRFVLVGDGPVKPSLVMKAASYGLSNVDFMDPVPKDRVPSLLASADATVITLKAAGAFGYAVSPNKLFDYMAAGKPVLCAVPGDMAEMVEKEGAGIAVQPEDPQALASAVIRLANMPPSELNTMGQKGRVLVETRFSRERLVDELVRIL